jgi:hypothetical protein
MGMVKSSLVQLVNCMEGCTVSGAFAAQGEWGDRGVVIGAEGIFEIIDEGPDFGLGDGVGVIVVDGVRIGERNRAVKFEAVGFDGGDEIDLVNGLRNGAAGAGVMAAASGVIGLNGGPPTGFAADGHVGDQFAAGAARQGCDRQIGVDVFVGGFAFEQGAFAGVAVDAHFGDAVEMGVAFGIIAGVVVAALVP